MLPLRKIKITHPPITIINNSNLPQELISEAKIWVNTHINKLVQQIQQTRKRLKQIPEIKNIQIQLSQEQTLPELNNKNNNNNNNNDNLINFTTQTILAQFNSNSKLELKGYLKYLDLENGVNIIYINVDTIWKEASIKTLQLYDEPTEEKIKQLTKTLLPRIKIEFKKEIEKVLRHEFTHILQYNIYKYLKVALNYDAKIRKQKFKLEQEADAKGKFTKITYQELILDYISTITDIITKIPVEGVARFGEKHYIEHSERQLNYLNYDAEIQLNYLKTYLNKEVTNFKKLLDNKYNLKSDFLIFSELKKVLNLIKNLNQLPYAVGEACTYTMYFYSARFLGWSPHQFFEFVRPLRRNKFFGNYELACNQLKIAPLITFKGPNTKTKAIFNYRKYVQDLQIIKQKISKMEFVETKSTSIKCPGCGALRLTTHKFCTKCGTKLSKD